MLDVQCTRAVFFFFFFKILMIRSLLLQSTQEDSTSDDENLLDFSVLFEMESLHKALLNIK